MRILITIVALTFTLFIDAQDKPLTAGEKRAVNLISNLPEVIAADKYIYTHGPDKRHVEIYIDGYPTRDNNNYLIRVCEFNGVLCHVHFFFYVNAKTFAIKYFDVYNNKSYPLKVWRKKRNRIE